MILRAMGLIRALKQANADKDKVIQHLLKPLDVFEIIDKMMSMPRWEDVNRKLIAQIVGDVVKIIGGVGK